MTEKFAPPFNVNGIDYTDPANKEQFFSFNEEQTLKALQQRERPPFGTPSASCDTNLFFGFFHDGTRNNYGRSIKDKDHTQSNVARLYSCFPGQGIRGVIPGEPEWEHHPDQFKHFFRVYTPGVGSAFDLVDDSGTGKDETLGAAMAWKGEPRIVWTLLQAINNLHRYFKKAPLIMPDEARQLYRKISLNRATLERMGKTPPPQFDDTDRRENRKSNLWSTPSEMKTFILRVTTLIASGVLLAACAISPRSDSKTGVDISGVNYSDQPITYIVSDPNDSAGIGAEPLDPFAAGGSMCCFRLPATWQPGIKVRVEILDTHRNPFKEEIVDLPPYVDGKPGRLWAVLHQDGSVEVLSSEYGPPHAKWPGKVKGWPVPTVEYRRKLWERDLELIKGDIRAAEGLIKQLAENPEKNLKRRWEHDKQYSREKIKSFYGPEDPQYKASIMKRNAEFLKSAQEHMDYWMKRKP